MVITTKQWQVIFDKRDELIKEFQWKPQLKQSIDEKLNEIRTNYNTSTIVAVHVGRTDYFMYIETYYEYFFPANASYYIAAMDYFR